MLCNGKYLSYKHSFLSTIEKQKNTEKKYSSLHRFIRVTDLCYWLTAIPSCVLYYVVLFFVVVVVNAGNAHVYFFISYIIFFCPDINRLVFVGVWGFIFIYFLLFPRERTKFFTTKYLYRRKIYSRWKFWDNKQQSYFFFASI